MLFLPQIYIVLAQMLGWYRTCECITSRWAGGGGYVDFTAQDTAGPWVKPYWIAGTVLTALVMGFSIIYITVEWCQQSFLSTENYDEAMRGLRRTRQYRSWTLFARQAARILSFITVHQLERLAMLCGIVKTRQKTLVWTKACKKEARCVERTTSQRGPSAQYATPLTELEQYSNSNSNAVLLRIQEPRAVVERTLSPRASDTFHRRSASDASSNQVDNLRLPPRPSEDSSTPLICVPLQVLRQTEGEVGSSSEERGDRSETGLSEQNPV